MALRANARVEDSTDYWGNTDHTYPTFSPIEAHGFRCIFKRKWSYVVPPRMRLGSKASVLHWTDDDVFPKAYCDGTST